MDDSNQNLAYYFEQRVQIRSRETAKTPLVSENYTRTGIVLMTFFMREKELHRDIREYETGKDLLIQFHKTAEVKTTALEELHAQSYYKRKNPHGLLIPIQIKSDLRNNTVVMAQNSDLGLPYEAISLPTVMYSLPSADTPPKLGDTWRNRLKIRIKPGTFSLELTTKWTKRDGIQISLETTIAEERAAFSEQQFSFSLIPAGTFQHVISAEDGLPVSSHGHYCMRMHAVVDAFGKRSEADVLDCDVTYELARIPLVFDKDTIRPSGWYLADNSTSKPAEGRTKE